MDFHKDPNQTDGTSKPSGFDFDSFLDTESLEDRLTAALDGRDVLESSPAPTYIPKYPADPNHGRHEIPAPFSTEQHPSEKISYDDDFWNEGADPRFIAPQRPKVVVRDPYEKPPVFETDPVGFENSGYPGQQRQYPGQQGPFPGDSGPYPPEDDIYNRGKKKKSPVGVIAAILGVIAAIMVVVLIANLSKHTVKNTNGENATDTDSIIQGITIPAKTDSPDATAQAQPTSKADSETNAVTYTITAAAGPGGEIQPSGTQTVREGESITFTIIANNGCEISDVQVDGESVSLDSRSRYTFSDVDESHTLNVTFTAKATETSKATTAPVISAATDTPAPTDAPAITDAPIVTDAPTEATTAPEAADADLLPPESEYGGNG